MFKYIILFLFLFYFFLNHKEKCNLKLLTVLFSCDRSSFLNKTIRSYFIHMNNYEPKIIYNLYFVDSGTYDRLNYVEYYNIKNTFYLNPSHYKYIYTMFWSYLHGEYILFLEDDRPFIESIERHIIYSNFVEESILILKSSELVKGITLKRDNPGYVRTLNVKTYLGNHILCIIEKPWANYYFSNGPSIYSIKHLLKTDNYISEEYMGKLFKKLKWYTGFTYKALQCKTKNNFSSECQGVSIHLGIGYSTQQKNNICRNYMY